MNEQLTAVRAALNANDLARAAALLNNYRAAATESLAYDRAFIQLSHELDIKQRRAAAGAARV